MLNLLGALDSTTGASLDQDPRSTITGNSGLTVEGTAKFIWKGGTIDLDGEKVVIEAGGRFTISGPGNVKTFNRGTLSNSGIVDWADDDGAGGIRAADSVAFVNQATGIWTCECDASISDISTNHPPLFTNMPNGVVKKLSNTRRTFFGLPFKNQGYIKAFSGTMEILAYDDSDSQIALADVELRNGNLVIDNAVVIHGGIHGTGQLAGNRGTTIDGKLSADLITVVGDLTNDTEVILGDAPGIITYNCGNNYYQTANGKLVVPIRGTNAVTPDFGQLKLHPQFGQVSLAGTLEVDITEGYAPPTGLTFPIISSSQRNGTFSQVILPPGMKLNYTPDGAKLIVTGAVPVQILSPTVTKGEFRLGLNTISNRQYTVQYLDDLGAGSWMIFSDLTGNESYWSLSAPGTDPHCYFRVSDAVSFRYPTSFKKQEYYRYRFSTGRSEHSPFIPLLTCRIVRRLTAKCRAPISCYNRA